MNQKFEALRRRAEELLERDSSLRDPTSVTDLARAIHEISVYQAELELQNEALRLSQAEVMRLTERYRGLYNDAPIGYITLDEKARITEANHTAQVMLNGKLHTFTGKKFSDLLYVSDRKAFEDFLATTMEYHSRGALEVRVIAPDTLETLNLRLEIYYRRYPAEDTAEILVAVMDITGLKRAQQALQQLTRTLEERVQQQTLVSVRRTEQLQALLAQLNDTEGRERRRLAAELHDYLAQLLVAARLKTNTVRKSISNTGSDNDLRTVEDLLSEATQYVRTMMSELSPAVLRESGLVPALHYLASAMNGQGLSVIVTDNGPVDVSAEMRDTVYSAVRELLHNSLKHSGVTTAYVNIGIDDSAVRIEVRDLGRGADEADLASADPLREKFGLFNIRERLESMDGHFEIHTSPGQGMQCILEVPAAIAAAPVCNLPMRLSPVRRHIIRLLVVDDHSVLRQGLVSYFSTVDDVEVVGQAENADTAFEMTRTLRPDAVLMDVNMSGITGVEATRVLKRDYPELVIFGLSMRDDEAIRREMCAAGATGHLSKDTSIDQIAAELRRACGVGLN